MATTFSGEQEIEALYVGYFGRAGDPAGVSYWVGQLNSGMSITAIAASFAVQTEAKSLYGFLASPASGNAAAVASFVTQVYQDLFNRAPDSGGLAYWTSQLQTANGNPHAVGQFILNVITGAQGPDASSIQNKVTVAQDFTDSLTAANLPYNTGADQIAHSAIAATTPFPSTVTTEESAVSNYISGQTSSGTPTPPAPIPTVALTVSGDTIHLSTTTAASTVSLTGADLTAYPSATFGTVAALIAAGTTSVTDSGGNFTLDASGNNHATTFNFGTGVVSGSDPASSAGITYSGVTTYDTSAHGDTVTLSAAAQNVTGAASGSDTVNLGALTYTGTTAFGASGSDVIHATAGGDISGGTISAAGATVALVLSGAGTETISSAEFGLFIATGITGSGGIEALSLNLASSTTLVDASFGASTISGIYGLEFNDTAVGSNFSLTTGANFASDFSTLDLTANTTTGTLGLALGSYVTGATISATSTTGHQTINVGTASGTAADSVTANSTSGAIDINIGNGADTVSATATTLGGVIHVTAGTGIDSITASSPDAVTITSTSTTGDTLLSGTSTTGAALTISANSAATTGTYNITANAATGFDTINVSGGTGTEIYNITLGAHANAAVISTSEIGTGAQATFGTNAPNTIITGIQTNDVLQISDGAASTFSSLGAEGSVNIGINVAHTSFPGPGNVQTFYYGPNTYLVEDVASNTPLPTSTVIELVGIHTISSVSAGAITLAS